MQYVNAIISDNTLTLINISEYVICAHLFQNQSKQIHFEPFLYVCAKLEPYQVRDVFKNTNGAEEGGRGLSDCRVVCVCVFFLKYLILLGGEEREREREKEKERKKEKRRKREKERKRKREKEIEKEKDRETERQKKRERETERKRDREKERQ